MGEIIRSPSNGTSGTWTTQDFGSQIIRTVSYGGGAWVIAGGGLAKRSTDDGLTWSDITMPFNPVIVRSDGTDFIAVANDGTKAVSVDAGVTWYEAGSFAGGTDYTDLAYSSSGSSWFCVSNTSAYKNTNGTVY